MAGNGSDIKFNSKELTGIFILLVVTSSLIFGLGVYVGKGMSETRALLFLKQQFKRDQFGTREPVTNITSEEGIVVQGDGNKKPSTGAESSQDAATATESSPTEPEEEDEEDSDSE